MSADLRTDIKPGDTVVLLHPDGTRLMGKLTGTDRWIAPGGIQLESLDTLLKHDFVVAKVAHVNAAVVEDGLKKVLGALVPSPGTTPVRAPVQASRTYEKPAGFISWVEHEKAWRGYAIESPGSAAQQDARRIAERGGFGYNEVVRFLGHAPVTWEAR